MTFPSYDSISHQFNFGVIYNYYNLKKNKYSLTDKYLLVHQQKRDVIFLYNPFIFLDNISDRNHVIYSETHISDFKKWEEIYYDLDELFSTQSPSISIRRGLNLLSRKNISFCDNMPVDDSIEIFNKWVDYKMNDDKVFKITFNPKRYLRSIENKIDEIDTKRFGLYVDNIPFCTVIFSIKNSYAYVLWTGSLHFNKNLIPFHDVNQCFLIYCYKMLHERGIKYVNFGPSAGIKGLEIFKKDIPYKIQTIYCKSVSIQKNNTVSLIDNSLFI